MEQRNRQLLSGQCGEVITVGFILGCIATAVIIAALAQWF